MKWRRWLNWKYQSACFAALCVGLVAVDLGAHGHGWLAMIPLGIALFISECVGQKFRLAYREQRCACGEIDATVFDSAHGKRAIDGCEKGPEATS